MSKDTSKYTVVFVDPFRSGGSFVWSNLSFEEAHVQIRHCRECMKSVPTLKRWIKMLDQDGNQTYQYPLK